MGSSRSASGANESNHFAAMHRGALLHVEAAQMPVTGRQTEVVSDDDQVAVIAGIGSGFDVAVSRREHRLTLFRGDVDALMKPWFAGEWIRASPKSAGEPSVRWPD